MLAENATYVAGGFSTTHHVEFLNNDRFNSSYRDALEHVSELLRGAEIEWRAHICCWAASQAIHLEGDFIECGVWYGILSKTICEYTDFGSQTENSILLIRGARCQGLMKMQIIKKIYAILSKKRLPSGQT